MPLPQIPPGYGGTLPWNSPSPATAQRPMPQGMSPDGSPTQNPTGGQQQQSPDPGMQNPLQGLPGAPGGAPTGALGAPANQPGSPMQQPMQPMQPQQPMAMAAGGVVKHLPRSHPQFGRVLQSAGIRHYASGGECRPVILSGRHGTAPGYANGGLVQAAKSVKDAGRLGDSILVHINPQEFKEMEAKHGPHSVNPETGLPEFGWLGDILKFAAPIALMLIPGLGEAIGGAILGAGATGSATLGSALIGAGIGGATGGLKGALIGGFTGGLGANLPANLGGLSEGATRGIEGAGLGALGSGLAGGNVLQGALLGGATGYAGSVLSGNSGNLAPKTGVGATSTPGATGEAPNDSVGYTHEASPLGSSSSSDLSTPTGDSIRGFDPTPAVSAVAAPGVPANATSSGSGIFGGSNTSKILQGLMLASVVGGLGGNKTAAAAGPPASNAPAYFNQPLNPTPYAPQINPEALRMLMQNPGAYASQGGPGYYNPGTAGFQFPQAPTTMAKGGALKQAARHISAPSPAARAGRIKGAGDGQSDSVEARLATGEHVFDALTVAAAGRGDNDAGHRRLEKLKQDIRREAGMKNAKKAPMMKEGALSSAFKRAR